MSSAAQYVYCFGVAVGSGRFGVRQPQGALNVDLALKLNVLAVMAVFAFVSAILLHAF